MYLGWMEKTRLKRAPRERVGRCSPSCRGYVKKASSRADYDTIGEGYAGFRRPDHRLSEQISSGLGDARSVVNVGAGTGSYEPRDREVIAVEPSAA